MRKAFIFVLILCLANMTQAQKRSKFDELITISTSFGEMKAILFEDTPLHRQNFLKLAKEGFYDSLLFHRVIESFMIQGGDPDSKNAATDQRLGSGGSGYRIDAEITSQHFHKKGAIASARTGDRGNPERKSSGSQFYVVQGKVYGADALKQEDQRRIRSLLEWSNNEHNALLRSIPQIYDTSGNAAVMERIRAYTLAMNARADATFNLPSERVEIYEALGGTPHLDGQYTVFGQVIDGLEVIDKIASVETNRANRPVNDVRMKITVERMKKKKITKLYGYVYQD